MNYWWAHPLNCRAARGQSERRAPRLRPERQSEHRLDSVIDHSSEFYTPGALNQAVPAHRSVVCKTDSATSGRGGRTSTRRSFTDAIASSRASKTRAHRARRFRRHIPPSCTASFRMTFWSWPPRLTICIFSRLKSLVPEYVTFARKGCVVYV